MLPRAEPLPFSRPDIGEDEITAVVNCLRSGWITTGPLTAQFEKDFAAATRARHALAFSSCTAALHVTLLAMGDPDRAQREWQAVLDLESDNARAKMYLRTLQLQRESGLFKASSKPPEA